MNLGLENLRRPLKAVVRRTIGTITHVSTQDAVVALTFDDGPHPEFTPRLLGILERHQAHATFFMVGEVAQRYPNLVQRVAQAGHAIGNHTWDHPSFPLISRQERRMQLRACQKALAPYGQRLFRPPYGQQSRASHLDAVLLGFQVITWNIVAGDWSDRDANSMVDELITKVKPGSVILFHDALYTYVDEKYIDRTTSFVAVNMLLEQSGDRFRFVTVPALLHHGRPERRNWYHRGNPEWLKDHKKQQRAPALR